MNAHLRILAILTVATFALALFGVGQNTMAASVEPTFIAGNPTCADAGYGFGFKVNGSANGTYFFTADYGELTGGALPDPNNSVTISNSDGIYFDWAASLGIDAVIVKGGPNANLYAYDPEALADTTLSAPINPENNVPFGLSHIEFCFDYELDGTKDASTSFVRTYLWDIEKSVTPDTWDLFTGDSGTSQYTVSVDKTGFADSDWAVSGNIYIENNTPFNATIEGVSDSISGVGDVAADCGVSFPYVLAAGDTLTCSYSTPLPDGSNRVNTAVITTSGPIGGDEASADVIFDEPTTEVNAEINVVDTNGLEWGPVSDDTSWPYEKTFMCDADEGTHNNTATIVETDQSDSASVTVNCYALEVTKDASTSFVRNWDWTIEKSGDQTDLILSEGQQFLVNYDVVVNASFLDSGFAVSGTIFVHNPSPIAATINDVADAVSPDIAATVTCDESFPYNLAANATLECTYAAGLPDAESRTNTATATQQNYDYDFMLNATPSGTTDWDGSAPVDFSDATFDEFDECVDVTDDPYGFLGQVCASEANTVFPFSYSLYVGPYAECGLYTFENIASFLTNDLDNTGSDNWVVNVDVPCAVGCTLTPGYWKTHSELGPAPYDDTWALLPNGADTPFYLSGKTYYQSLWTAPAGNAYYILSHAFIAAQLNFLNGADPSAAQAAFDEAKMMFETYTPADIAALKGKAGNNLRAQFIELAQILDDYNNGLIGPGHCSE